MWELILFILVGCLGGLVGAWFNGTNERLSIYRMTKMKGRGLRGKRPVNTKGHAYREGPMSAFTTPHSTLLTLSPRLCCPMQRWR